MKNNCKNTDLNSLRSYAYNKVKSPLIFKTYSSIFSNVLIKLSYKEEIDGSIFLIHVCKSCFNNTLGFTISFWIPNNFIKIPGGIHL